MISLLYEDGSLGSQVEVNYESADRILFPIKEYGWITLELGLYSNVCKSADFSEDMMASGPLSPWESGTKKDLYKGRLVVDLL